MEVEIKIDKTRGQPLVIVETASITEEVQNLVQRLSQTPFQVLAGAKDGKLTALDPSELFRIYASGGSVYAVTAKGTYALRLRLYELEEQLDKGQFVRISNSEIINLKKAAQFDLNLAGTIQVKLANGDTAWVSRRYVPKIKQILGLSR